MLTRGNKSNAKSRTDLTILSASNFADDFVLLLIAPIDSQGLVIPVVPRSMDVDIGIYSNVNQGMDL